MSLWCRAGKVGVVLGATGLLVAGYVFSVAEAQPTPTLTEPQTLSRDSLASPPPAFGTQTLPASQPILPTASSSVTGQSIEQLMQQLQSLRTRKADLDRQEKEVITALKGKLNEQQQRLQNLGVFPASCVPGKAMPPAAMDPTTLPSPVPTFRETTGTGPKAK
jgi:hypothetical protein